MDNSKSTQSTDQTHVSIQVLAHLADQVRVYINELAESGDEVTGYVGSTTTTTEPATGSPFGKRQHKPFTLWSGKA